MINENNFVKVSVTPEEFKKAKFMAEQAEIGGVSRIFSDKDERLRRQKIDSLVGQLGTMAGCKYFYGDIQNYIVGRYMQNKFPRQGDGGEDIIGCNIDFKASLKRYSRPALKYHLLVRPRERHEDQIYIHGLILPWDEGGRPKEVIFTGWATDDQLPEHPESSGVLKGAYAIEVEKLNPLLPIKWNFYKKRAAID